jgi:hypothetical protein
MSGQWPPDWEDADDDVEAEAGQADAETSARLSEVTAYLAALPQPVLPEALEARISAAIAAEAADRAKPGRTLGRPPRRPKVRRDRRFRIQAISSAAACLVLAGFAYLLTQVGGSSSSSSAAVAAGTAAPTASAPQSQANSAEHSFSGAAPAPALAEPTAASSASAPGSPRFTVIARGDVYEQSTLVSQVRQALADAVLGLETASAATVSAPTAALTGCVSHFTGNAVPGLVDKATYDGKPVYVIAVSSRAWVVGRGCTATDPELITTVSLAGLRGNPSALGSVEGYAIVRRG